MVTPKGSADDLAHRRATTLDLLMVTAFGGRQRTLAEVAKLAAAAGLAVAGTPMLPIPSRLPIIELSARP